MKINGTLLISQILYRHNMLVLNAQDADLLSRTDVVSEVLEYAEAIRIVMDVMNESTDTLIDYDNVFTQLEERRKAVDAAADTKATAGQMAAWCNSISELNAMKGWMHA